MGTEELWTGKERFDPVSGSMQGTKRNDHKNQLTEGEEGARQSTLDSSCTRQFRHYTVQTLYSSDTIQFTLNSSDTGQFTLDSSDTIQFRHYTVHIKQFRHWTVHTR